MLGTIINMRQLILIFFTYPILFVSCNSQHQNSYKDGYVTVSKGVELYYEKVGDGQEIIIIPSGMYYSPIFKQLASPDRTLIIYDQRGRGKSTSIIDSTQLGWKYEVEDIESIRKHLNFEMINIIGWSYSGAIAAMYAKTFPQVTSRIVLIGPMPIKKVPYWEEYLRTSQSRRPDDYDSRIQLIQNNFEQSGELERYIKDYYQQSHQLLLVNKSIIETFRDDFYSCPNERPDIMWGSTFPTIIASFGDWDFTDQLDGLAAKTLIIQGTYDAVPMESAKEWNTAIPNSRLWVIDEVGHMPFVEKPKEVLSGIDGFLNGNLD